MPEREEVERIAGKLSKRAARELIQIARAPTPQVCWEERLWLLELVERANNTWIASNRVVATDLGRAVAAALRDQRVGGSATVNRLLEEAEAAHAAQLAFMLLLPKGARPRRRHQGETP